MLLVPPILEKILYITSIPHNNAYVVSRTNQIKPFFDFFSSYILLKKS